MKHYGILIHPQDISSLWPRRLAKAGIDLLGLHPVGGVEAPRSLADLLERQKAREMQNFLASLADHGIQVEHEMHALGYLVPPTLLDSHPAYFPMDEKGRRVPGPNLCASCAEGLAYLADQSARLAEALPSPTHRYFFWLDDTATRGCQCPACRALSPSDQQLRLLNAMLRGIRRVDPSAKLAYLAYVSTLEPPRQTRPEPGIFLEFAPIGRDFHRPINDPTCEKNAFQAAHLPELLVFFGKEDARVLEYWMDNSLFSGWKRPPKPFALDEATLRTDAAFYRALGFTTLTSFGCFLGPDYEALYGEPPLAAYGQGLRA